MHVAQRTGWTPLLLVDSAQDKKCYEAQGGIPFSGEILVCDDYYLALVNGSFDDESESHVWQRAAEYERRHRVTLMRSMILADRHMGRAFIPGGAGYPLTQISKRTTLTRTFRACLASIQFWEQLASSRPPALVLSYGGGGGVSGKPCALLCRERGVPLRVLFPFRFGDAYYWGRDEFGAFPELEAAIREFPSPDDAAVEKVAQNLQPNGLATSPFYVDQIARDLMWRRIGYLSGRFIIQWIYGRAKGYRKMQIGPQPFARIVNFINARRNMNRLDHLAIRDLSKLDGRKIVYFPLQQEPESSTLVLSPYCTNQLATIRELALSLPADAQLVVKEHVWALYGRPQGFYDQLVEIPNVVLAHPRVSSLELIRRAALVCVITSSAGYEAAVLGKFVVHLGFSSTLFILSHVKHFVSPDEFDAIPGIIADADNPTESVARRQAGARYYLAAESVCMDLSPLHIHGRKDLLTDDECAILAEPLFRSLEPMTLKQHNLSDGNSVCSEQDSDARGDMK